MNLNKKYIIGTHVMFYEIEMISEFVDSVINSCELIDNKTNVTVDLFFNMSEFFERIDETQITKKELINKFMVEVNVAKTDEETIWTQYNSTGLYAWEIMGVKRSMDYSVDPNGEPGGQWRSGTSSNIADKFDLKDPNSLKFAVPSYPVYTVETYTNVDTDDGDNDLLANYND